jgi:hypothetical protein
MTVTADTISRLRNRTQISNGYGTVSAAVGDGEQLQSKVRVDSRHRCRIIFLYAAILGESFLAIDKSKVKGGVAPVEGKRG